MNRNHLKTILKVLFISGLVLIPSRTFAGSDADRLRDTEPSAYGIEKNTESDWTFAVTPYVWLTGMSGEVAPVAGVPAVEVNTSFTDVIDGVKAGGFLMVTAYNNDLMLSGDFSYGIVGGEGSMDQIPVVVEVESTQVFGSMAAGWRCLQTSRTELYITAGFRAWELTTKVNASLGEIDLVSIDESYDWMDPLVGLRFRAKPFSTVSLDATGEIGGFGIGSDFTWHLLGAVSYRISDQIYSSLGYRHISVDYKDNGHIFDADLSGILIGLTMLF